MPIRFSGGESWDELPRMMDGGVFEEFWKQGVKRSLLIEAKGIPLSVVVDGANRHDMKLGFVRAGGWWNEPTVG